MSQSPLLTRTGIQPVRPLRLNQTLTENSKMPLFLKKGISIFEGLLKTPQSPHKPHFLRKIVQTPLDAMKSHFQSSNGSPNVMHANGLNPITGGGLPDVHIAYNDVLIAHSKKHVVRPFWCELNSIQVSIITTCVMLMNSRRTSAVCDKMAPKTAHCVILFYLQHRLTFARRSAEAGS